MNTNIRIIANDGYIYCCPNLASKLTLQGVSKLCLFIKDHIKYEFGYYHSVVVYDEIFDGTTNDRNVFEDIFGSNGENLWQKIELNQRPF